MNLRIYGWAILAVLLAQGVAAQSSGRPVAPPAAIVPLTTAPGVRAPAEPEPLLLGEGEVAALIQAGEEATVSSQMAGKISRIHVGLGEQFRAGSTILEFDCSEQRAQLQTAQAEYRGTRETHLSRMRLQALGAAGELEVTLAAAAAEKAKGQVSLRESQLAYCTVKAPFSGRVARLRVKTAESVPVGQALADLVDAGSLKIQLFVPVSWYAWLKPKSAFTMRIKETGRSYAARVTKLNARVEGVSQQLEVEGRFESADAGLLPGMVGTAVFSSR